MLAMSEPITRREVLRGLAALPVALAVPVAAAAPPPEVVAPVLLGVDWATAPSRYVQAVFVTTAGGGVKFVRWQPVPADSVLAGDGAA